MNLPKADEKEWQKEFDEKFSFTNLGMAPALKSYLVQKRIEWITQEIEKIKVNLEIIGYAKTELGEELMTKRFLISYLDSRLNELRK